MSSIYAAVQSDHAQIMALIDAVASMNDRAERRAPYRKARNALLAHILAEHNELYSVLSLRDESSRELVDQHLQEHAHIELLLAELEGLDCASPRWMTAFRDLATAVAHHIEREEAELFERARSVLSDADAAALGQQFESVHRILQTQVEAGLAASSPGPPGPGR